MSKLAAAIVLAFAALLLTPTPAHAGPSGNFTHIAPDDGYDRHFTVTCWGGGTIDVHEGQTSWCQFGVASIYVAAGQEIWCRYTSYNGTVVNYLAWDATGGHSTSGTISTRCLSQAD